jgi:hypothetical protein
MSTDPPVRTIRSVDQRSDRVMHGRDGLLLARRWPHARDNPRIGSYR